MPEIRPLASDEVEQVGAVLGLARLGQAAGVYLVSWEDGRPTGHAHLALGDPPELQDVEVRPAYRRRGIASALVRAVEAEAVARGCSRVRVQVSATSVPAQALYHRLGYRDTGLPPIRVRGTVQIRTGPLEVDDTLLTWEKPLRH